MADKINISPPIQNNGGHAYRLQVISDLKKSLVNERNARESLYKKYHRGSNVIDAIDVGLTSASMSMSVATAVLISLSQLLHQ